MIEDNGLREPGFSKALGGFSIVSSLGNTAGRAGNEYSRNRVVPWISSRIRIRMKLLD
jgi:hypothetical protein